MKIFAISDLHLSVNNPKPMDIFGPVWDNYIDKVIADWKAKVAEDDIVLLAGDFSWAMNLEDTKEDFALLQSLPGKKVIIRGNHDYWWKSISAVRGFIPQGFYAIQNDAIKLNNFIICGTRGWQVPEEGVTMTPENQKIFSREVIRLGLTLKAAQALKTDPQDKIICLMHYPPTNFKKQNSPFTDLLERFSVDEVVFGHLHKYKNIALDFQKNGLNYHLTSCDLLENKLKLIYEE